MGGGLGGGLIPATILNLDSGTRRMLLCAPPAMETETMTRRLPLAHIGAQPPDGTNPRTTTLGTEVGIRDNTTLPHEKPGNTTLGTRDGNQRTTTPGRRNRDNTTPGNQGNNSGTHGYRVFQTRRMPAEMLQDIKAVAVLLRLSQQDVVLRCIEEALVGLCEDEGLDWDEVRALAERL